MPRSPRSAVLRSWLGAGFLTLPLHIIAPAKHTHVHNARTQPSTPFLRSVKCPAGQALHRTALDNGLAWSGVK